MIDLNAVLDIERLSERGEGFARAQNEAVFVPYALPGEKILAERDGSRAKIVEILQASPDRVAPFCQYFGTCGGCALQMLENSKSLQWKRDCVDHALRRAKLNAPVADAIEAHGAGRRRVVFHARYPHNSVQVGFMQARSHALVEIDHCPLLSESLRFAPDIARKIAKILAPLGKPLDLAVTETDEGLDVDLRGCGPLDDRLREKLIAAAQDLSLARLSNHSLLLVSPRSPKVRIGRANVVLPAGGFLQATVLGEKILGDFVMERIAGAKKAADLFCGIGTFALRMAEACEVDAFEAEPAALASLDRAWREAQNLRRLRLEKRDLFRRPLSVGELENYDAVVFDPPRAGAENVCREIAAGKIAKIVAVSCNPETFARDAAILIAGGCVLEEVVPLDQFRASPHVEIMAFFTRPRVKKPRRALLSR